MKLNKLNHETVAKGFGINAEIDQSLEIRLLRDNPSCSTKYCTLSTNTEAEIEESGLYFIADSDEGKRLAEIKFEIELLPRVKSPSRKVAFLDRDGILIKDTEYPGLIKDVIFLPEVIPLLRQLKTKGFEFIVVTNQSGIGRGKYTIDDFKGTTKYIESFYHSLGIDILETYYCPYHKEAVVAEFKKNSYYRKPQSGMHVAAAEKHGIDIAQSIMIGDRKSDKIKLSSLRCFTVGTTDPNSDFKTFQELQAYLEDHLPD